MKTVIPFSVYFKKLQGCFLGKSIGGTLGGPYEGHTGPLNLTYYNPVPVEMMPNDDLDLQVIWLENIRRRGLPINRRSLADAWIENNHLWPDEYGVAVKNISQGLYPPVSGYFDNYFSSGMGAAIRSEIWACLAPGDPGLAISFAKEDACADHDGEGIFASLYLTALESAAFVESDRERLLDIAASYIPYNCRVARAIADTRKLWGEWRDWSRVRKYLIENHGRHNWTDVALNLAYTLLGWLAGEDFGNAICTTVNCGADTDCSAATLGALLGIINPNCITEKWLKPIGKSLVLSPEMVGMHQVTNIDEFCEQLAEMSKDVLEFYDSKVRFSDCSTFSKARFNMSGAWCGSSEGIKLEDRYNVRESLVATEPLVVNILYPDSVALVPGIPSNLTVTVYNPTESKLEGTLVIQVPDFWRSDKRELEFLIQPKHIWSFNFNITAPMENVTRVYRNILDLKFNVNGIKWTVSAGMVITIPWLRCRMKYNLDLCPDLNNKSIYERYEAVGHTQLIPEGEHVIISELKIPYPMIVHYLVQATRPVKVWLDGELIKSHNRNFYVPAFHRNEGTGVDIDEKRGWHRVTIWIGDGKEGELFFGLGSKRGLHWITDVEWRMPVL